MRRQLGFTLVESVVSIAVLAIIMSTVFYLFDFGREQFAIGVMRTGFSNDIRLVTTTLSRDIKLSALEGFQLDVPKNSSFTVGGKSYTASRQALSFPTLKDWSDGTAQYDNASGLPIYNTYILWGCSGHTPEGNLFRIELNAPNNQGQPINAVALGAATNSLFGGLSPGVVNYGTPSYRFHRTMARSVTHMSIEYRSVVDQPTHVEVTLRFMGRARGNTAVERVESSEIVVRAAPGNHSTF